ncbi:MAG: hypothetical protein HQM10_01090 [Candidatus Riflebacteria bacterium]|nr:hypothetical protein [Candidatus Riflebacteria bacterium]
MVGEKSKVYNFMSDFVFKYVFGQEKNKKLLTHELKYMKILCLQIISSPGQDQE